jgi:two-component system sensor histidine kinase KdpD
MAPTGAIPPAGAPARERLLVAVGPSVFSESLVRLAARLAAGAGAELLAVYVDTGRPTTEEAQGRLNRNLNLARSLGAKIVSLSDPDLAHGILEAARREGAGRVVVGKPVREPRWRQWLGLSLANELLHASGTVDILLVHPDPAVQTEDWESPPAPPVPMNEYLVTLGLLVWMTGFGLLIEHALGQRSVPLVFLLVLTLATMRLRRGPALVLALGAMLSWNYFYAQPLHTFRITNPEDWLIIVLFGAVPLAMGHLTNLLRLREQAGREGERRANALYQLTRVLSTGVDLDQSIVEALQQIESAFDAQAGLARPVVKSGAAGPPEWRMLGHLPLGPQAGAVAEWVQQNAQPAGRFTTTLAYMEVMGFPLRAGETTFGVLLIEPRTETGWSPLQFDLLSAFAAHLSALLEKDKLWREADEARLAAASQTLQRALLDNVSHELKTPVAVIKTSLQRMGRGQPSAEWTELAHEAERASGRLEHVVSHIVDMARIESGVIRPDLVWCDAADMLQDIVSDQAEAAKRRGVRLEVAAGDLTFPADPHLLQAILVNLVSNAIRFSPAGGTVVLGASRAGELAQLTVTDQGPGLPAAEATRVFERFYRRENTTGGLGLGLSIARAFAESMGGTVRLDTRHCGGASFVVELPVGSPAAAVSTRPTT